MIIMIFISSTFRLWWLLLIYNWRRKQWRGQKTLLSCPIIGFHHNMISIDRCPMSINILGFHHWYDMSQYSPLEQNKDMHLSQSNRDGKRSEKVKMVLDLSKSKEIRLHPDHNCQVRRIYVSNLTTTTEGISPTKAAPRVRQEWRFWAFSGLHFQSPYITNSQPNLNPSILKILTHLYKGGMQTSRPGQRNSWRVWPGSVRVGDHRESITMFSDRPHTKNG